MESLMMIARGLVSEASWSSVRNFQKMPKQNFPVGVPGVPSVLIAGSHHFHLISLMWREDVIASSSFSRGLMSHPWLPTDCKTHHTP